MRFISGVFAWSVVAAFATSVFCLMAADLASAFGYSLDDSLLQRTLTIVAPLGVVACGMFVCTRVRWALNQGDSEADSDSES